MADAHLVGSVNLDTAEDVFRVVSQIAGDCVTRMPDGETGPRSGWIWYQIPRLIANPSLEPGPRPQQEYVHVPTFKLRDGVDPDDVVFDLGLSTAAADSYAVFRRLKQEGVIRPEVKFQVGVPTPVAVLGVFISPADQPRLAGAYERRLAQELAEITGTVPRDELALQWEVAVEFSMIEGAAESVYDTTSLLDQLGRLAAMVPDDITLGYHLCYGDAPSEPGGHGQHFMQPVDTANLVMVARGILDRAHRPIGFLHLPVPIDRDDDAYFAPLEDLRLPDTTKLYLGLVHYQDGLDGTQRRADVAARHVGGFGVATECGMGRRPREVIPDLLRIHRDVKVGA